MPAVKPHATKKLSSSGASPKIGSPSAETGIGPLMIVWMPISLRIGNRSAQGSANSSRRSMFSGNNSRPKAKGGRDRQHPFVPFSHPPIANAPISGLR
jgi:hypothetical protein